MDAATAATMDGRYGSDAVHRVDLRPFDNGWCGSEASASGDAASDRSGEEEERPGGCAKDRRPASLRLLSGMPHGAARSAGPQAGAALRNLLVRQAVQMKNKVSGLLMEAGIPYNQQKVHQKKYFAELLQKQQEEMPPSMPALF